ncbi:MAG: D-alanyl-D-alanine carboxypeptidase [Tissierellia bacterium]|nr:D-alanyl-D-alanine carboxypeptidase [Tissierellia bacterium]
MKKAKYIVIFLIIFLYSSIVYGENLDLTSSSSILIDSSTGRILYEKNPHIKMPMASTTKIMTALVALEQGNLDDEVIIKKEAVGIEGSSIYLREGEKISLEELLYGLMLRSGNDAAVAIAIHIGGSLENFIELMNHKAKEIGAVNTNFSNPHGLHDDSHYTTAYDLALITREAFKHEVFARIVGAKSYTSNRLENNYYYNKNKTLWEYKGGDGVKTGYTMRSGRCLVSSATRNNHRLIAVSLNARDWFNDNYKLLDYGFTNYKPYLIYDKGQFIHKIDIEKGKKKYLDLVTDSSFTYLLKEDERQRLKLSIEVPDVLVAPIEKGTKIGYIYSFLDGKLINKSDLIAKSSIRKANILERLIEGFKGK